MNGEFLVISGATEGSRYVRCLRQQGTWFASRGLRYRGYVVPSRGSWGENTKIKPEVVRLGFQECPVVFWVDADCTIDPPSPFPPPGEWDVATTANCHPLHKCKISAGFLMFRRTDQCLRFLDIWEWNNTKVRKDHPAMMVALREFAATGGKVHDMTEWLRGRHTINRFAPGRGMVDG